MNDYLQYAYECNDPHTANMLIDAELVKRLLQVCCISPGATVTITVDRNDGNTAHAILYDHAALVQSLIDALEYFQSELI